MRGDTEKRTRAAGAAALKSGGGAASSAGAAAAMRPAMRRLGRRRRPGAHRGACLFCSAVLVVLARCSASTRRLLVLTGSQRAQHYLDLP